MRNKHAALVAQRFYSRKDLFSLRILSLGMSPLQEAGYAEKAVSAQDAANPGKQRRLAYRLAVILDSAPPNKLIHTAPISATP
jgi:hypothetical protein